MTVDRQHAVPSGHRPRPPKADRSGVLRHLSHLARQEDGASAVEFAFVLPVLLVLLTGMVNVGMLFLTQNNMMRVAQSAARSLSLAQMNETETEAYIAGKLANLGGTLAVDATLPNSAAVPPETDVTVTISIPMVDVIPIDIVGMKNVAVFQTGSLQTQITMPQEVPQ